MKIFLSSTYLDLVEHRKAVVQALRTMGEEVGHMEVFGANDNEPTKASLEELDECDAVVGVYAYRYGTVPKGSKVSVTEEEYLYAASKNLPILVFVINEDHDWPPKKIDENLTRIKKFKSKLTSEHTPAYFTTPDNLATQVVAAVGRLVKKSISDSRPGAEALLSQELYIQRCIELINNAKKQVIIRTSKMSKSEDLPEAAAVNQAIRTAREKGVKIRILVATNYDRLPGAIALADMIGADVRFDPEIPISDINYYCADGSHLLIATRQPSSESQHRRSTSWIEFRSTFLASVLFNHFDRRWEAINTRRLDEYMSEVLPVAIKSQGLSTVSDQIGKEPSSIEQFIHLRPFVIFIIGRPGSGKTTIARLIKENLPSTGVYLRIFQVSDLEYLRKVFATKEDESRRFEKTADGGFFILDPTLYDEALVDLSVQVLREMPNNDLVIVEFARQSYLHALKLISNQGVHPNLIVYVKASFETALERNKLRSIRSSNDRHFVSEKEMRKTYANDDIEKLQKSDKFKTIIIDNNQDVINRLDEKVFSIIEKVKDATR